MHNIFTLIYAYLSVSRWMFNNYVKFFILFHLSYTPTFWFNSIFYFLFIFHFFFCFKTSFFLLWKKFVKVDDFTICRAKQKFCLWDCIVNKNEVKIQSKMYECILLLTTNCCLSLIAALPTTVSQKNRIWLTIRRFFRILMFRFVYLIKKRKFFCYNTYFIANS